MLTALHAYDIHPDGRARKAPDIDATPAIGASWRWLHFAVSAPGLREWTETTLPLTAAHALTQAETRPRCDPHGEGLILNLRGINRNPGQEPDDMVSIRLWVTPTLIVSTRVRRVFAAEELHRLCDEGAGPVSPSDFLVALTLDLTDRIEAASLQLEDQTDEIEDRILDENGDGTGDLAPLRATAIKLRRHVLPQREALSRLAAGPEALIGPGQRIDLSEIAERTTRTVEELDSVTQRLTALQDHAATQLNQQLSQNSFVLSVVASIFLPLGTLSGIFGVNLGGIPGSGNPWAFPVFVGVTVAIGVGLLWLFRRMRWF